MGRRAFHRHLISERVTRPYEFDKYEPQKTPYWADADFVIALCGEEYRIGAWKNDSGLARFLERAEEKHVSCPDCRKKIARAKLKARPADAPKLSLEADKDAKGGFRHSQGWKALIDGEPVAILGFEEHGWRIYPYVAEKDSKSDEVRVRNTFGVLLEDGMTGSRFDSRGYRLPSNALEFKTKEDALMACEPLRASGRLKTPTEALADYEVRQRRAVEWADERSRKLAERDQKWRDTLAALEEVLEKETLTNFQREGVMNAIEMYKDKLKPVDEL